MTDKTFPVPMKVRIRWRFKSEGPDRPWRYGDYVSFGTARAAVNSANRDWPQIHHEIAPD